MIQENIIEDLKDRFPELIKKVDDFLSNQEICNIITGKDLGTSQIRSLIDISGRAVCTEELFAYIRYKVGRDKDRKGWGSSISSKSNKYLGECLIDVLKEITDNVAIPNVQEKAKLSLMSRFFGYLYWQVTYKKFASVGG